MGGGEVALLNLAVAINPAKFDLLVVLFAEGALAERLRAAGIRVRVCPLDPGVMSVRKDSLGVGTLLRVRDGVRTAMFARRLAAVLREEGVALVHTNSLKSDLIGGVAGRLAGLPVVWHVRDRIADDYLPRRVAELFRLGCRILPSRLIANSGATRQTLGAAIGSRTTIVHDGTPILPAENAVRRDAGLVVGLVGRLTEWKGQHIFLDAAARVLQRFPKAEFRLIGAALFGEEHYELRLREQVSRSKIGHAVEFCGFCDDVHMRVSQLDVLVHASVTGEPFGQVVIEGMAAGKPVVATNGGGIPEIVVDGVTGLLVPMGDATAMAVAIVLLLNDPMLRRRMGSAGRHRVQHLFTIQQTADAVQAVYTQVLTNANER